MTIVFRIPASAAERVGFAYSPSMEAVLSLHVLVEPKHHPVQHGFVRAMRGLSKTDRATLTDLLKRLGTTADEQLEAAG